MTHNTTPLFRPPSPETLENISKTLAASSALFPVPPSHRKELPRFIRDLSRTLTEDRSEMARPYWASPGLFSAYLHFFLPWNLYRMAWLLPGLDLGLAANAHVLDLGSGPLTLPLALWCSRPDLRKLPLRFTCVDVSMQAMERGQGLLKTLAGEKSPWEIHLFRAPLEKALQVATRRENGEQAYDCIAAANVLNELANERARAGTPPLEQRLGGIVEKCLARLRPDGRLLVIEPGTRLGSKVVTLARSAALEMGCEALAPCTHSGPCPMQPRNEEREQDLPAFSGWCHFTHPVNSAPPVLTELGEEAHLLKRSMALSCLLLQKHGDGQQHVPHSLLDDGSDLDALEALYAEIMGEDPDSGTPPPAPPKTTARPPERPARQTPPGPMPARVISAPITLPDKTEPGRYACCERGLALLLDARQIPSGSAVMAQTPRQTQTANTRRTPEGGPSRNEREERDKKSGALVLVKVENTVRQKPEPGSKSKEQRGRGQQGTGDKTRASGKTHKNSKAREGGKAGTSGKAGNKANPIKAPGAS